MAKIYYRRIKAPGSAFTIADVPERWREETQALLEADETQTGGEVV